MEVGEDPYKIVAHWDIDKIAVAEPFDINLENEMVYRAGLIALGAVNPTQLVYCFYHFGRKNKGSPTEGCYTIKEAFSGRKCPYVYHEN